MGRVKISFVHLLPAPYRLPIFERLLADKDFEVRLFLTQRPSENRPTWSTRWRSDDSRIVWMPEIGVPRPGVPGDKIRFNTGLGQIFEWNPDVVLIGGHNEATSLMAAAMCMRKHIAYILMSEVSRADRWSLQRRLMIPILRPIVKNAAILVPSSESCAEFFAKLGASRNRMSIIPCVPDVERLMMISRALRDNAAAIRRKNNLEERFVLLFVGRLTPNKGIIELIEAMRGVARRNPKVTLVIVGYGPLENYVREKTLEAGKNIRFLGLVDDSTLHELYTIADLHIMPSWNEPFGVVCAEALSFGTPSIITDTSGCVELIRNGVNGLVIRSRDRQAIEDSILRISLDSELHTKMKMAASSTMEHLTADVLYAKLKDAILSALNAQSPV